MKLNYFFSTILFLALFSSCLKDDSDGNATTVTITGIESSKEFAFIEETITINIKATGFSNVEASSDNSNISITKIDNLTYTINSVKAADTDITFTFTGEEIVTETVSLSFYEHGVINFKVTEGITLDLDTPEKVRALHGDPDYISPQDDNEEVWYYFEKGFWVLMDNNVNQAHYMRLYGIDWSRTLDEVEYIGQQYPYEISEGLKIENLQLNMTTVLEKFGSPTEKLFEYGGTRTHAYDYEDLEVLFYFQSDDIDDYEGKNVGYINVY